MQTKQREKTPEKSDTELSGKIEKIRKKKRRLKYKNILYFVNTAVCLAMFFGVGIHLVNVERASGFIQSENRNLAEFPEFSLKSYLSGEYTEGIINYYTDTIPSREKLRSTANRFSNLFGIHGDDVEFYGNAPAGNYSNKTKKDENSQPEQTVPADTVTVYTGTRTTATNLTTAVEQSTEPIVTKKRMEVPDDGAIVNGSVIVSGKGTPDVRAMSMFYGAPEIGQSYAEVLNQYKDMVGETVNVYNMSIPLASAYYMPSNLAETCSDQHEAIKNIARSLNNVINVDVFDTLADHADEYIYFRTDHHWQPLGAYYAAKQFAETAGVPFAELDEYEPCAVENFCGTMYGYTNYLEDLITYPDTFTYYKPKSNYTVNYYDQAFMNPQTSDSLFVDWAEGVNSYSTIIGGDLNIVEVNTEVDNDRTLVLIKNSYGNALVPFFVGSFEKIYVVDFRYVQVGMQNFFQLVGATDVLFGMAIFSCYTPEHIYAMSEIMY